MNNKNESSYSGEKMKVTNIASESLGVVLVVVSEFVFKTR